MSNPADYWTNQECGTDYSFIGNHFRALQLHDTTIVDTEGHHHHAASTEVVDHKEEFKGFKAKAAADFIIQAAKKHQIVIINEAHHNASHRAFVHSLLPGLANAGFKYIGCEAISVNDSLINERGYPIMETGTYTDEPSFGNLLRSARNHGMILFGYESKKYDREREIGQAQNIKAFLDNHPKGKVLIYCGYDHAIKDTVANDWEWAMAGRLKQLTGIDPFTIDQVELSERGFPEKENSWRKVMNFDQPMVFIDEKTQSFGTAVAKKRYDLNVYHPNTRIVNGRPHWKFVDGRTPAKVNSHITISYPCLVKAYSLHESAAAVPLDIIELKNASDEKCLALTPKQVYRVEITNKIGEKQVEEIMH